MFDISTLLNPAIVGGALVALVVVKFTVWYFFPFYIPGIPIMKSNHILGYSMTRPKTKGRFDSQLRNYEASEEVGKIYQYYSFGRLNVFTSDKYLTRFMLDNILGKGFFHVAFDSAA